MRIMFLHGARELNLLFGGFFTTPWKMIFNSPSALADRLESTELFILAALASILGSLLLTPEAGSTK